MVETLNSQEGVYNAREKYHMGDFVYDKVSKKSYLEIDTGSDHPSHLEMTTIENLTSNAKTQTQVLAVEKSAGW